MRSLTNDNGPGAAGFSNGQGRRLSDRSFGFREAVLDLLT